MNDPTGLDVHYATADDKKFYEKAASRNWRVKGVLNAFGPGSGRDLYITHGDPGKHANGTQKAANTVVSLGAPKDFQQKVTEPMVKAYNDAGGGEKGDAAAKAVYEKAKYEVSSAEIKLGEKAGDQDKLHELGHVDQALKDPATYSEQAAEAAKAPTDKEYHETESEKYADRFAREAKENAPNPPPPQ